MHCARISLPRCPSAKTPTHLWKARGDSLGHHLECGNSIRVSISHSGARSKLGNSSRVSISYSGARSENRSRTRSLDRRIDLELGRSIGESIANSVARSENRSRTRSRDQRIDLQLGRSIRESISNSVARCKRNSTTRSTGLLLCGSTERRSSGWSIQQHEAVTRLSHGRTCTQTLPRPFVGNQVMSVCSPWTQRMWGRVLERLQLCKIKMYTKVPNHACSSNLIWESSTT